MKNILCLAMVLLSAAYSMADHWVCDNGKCRLVKDPVVLVSQTAPQATAKFTMTTEGTVVQTGTVVSGEPLPQQTLSFTQSDCPTCPNYVAPSQVSTAFAAPSTASLVTFNTQVGLVNFAGDGFLSSRAERLASVGLVQGQPLRNLVRILFPGRCR